MQPIQTELPQVRTGVFSVWQLKPGQVIAFAGQVHFAAVGDFERVAERFRDFGKEVAHLLRTAQIIRVVRHGHAACVGKEFSGLDGQEHILHFRVFAPDVMHVVGGNHARLKFFRQPQQAAVDLIELGQVVVLNFQEKAVPSKQIQVPAQGPFGFLGVAIQQRPRQFA